MPFVTIPECGTDLPSRLTGSQLVQGLSAGEDCASFLLAFERCTVVDPGQDQTTGQGLCQFHSQQVSNVSDSLRMVIAQSRHRRGHLTDDTR